MEPNDQHDDQLLRDALLGVSAPDGLHQRLLARLQQEAAESSDLHRTVGSPDGASQVNRLAERSQRERVGRRQWVGWALALSLVGIAFGVYRWSRPASIEQLTQFTFGQLDALQAETVVWQTGFADPFAELSILEGQLRFDFRPIGFHDQSGGVFAEHCRVWRLDSPITKRTFYVFDFQNAVQVQSLTRQLQAIRRNSGGWSLVAMQDGDRLVVVLVEGAPDSYLYRPLSA